jgi:hypothetical protein
MADHLILKQLDTCMPTAINLYFDEQVFDSLDSFLSKQTERNSKILKVKINSLDSYLMNHVRVGTHNYKKLLVFNTKNPNCPDFPSKIPNHRKRAILHYQTITFPKQAHVEAITIKDGVVKYLCYPTESLLPYTNMTLNEYISKVRADQLGDAFLDMFVYKTNSS